MRRPSVKEGDVVKPSKRLRGMSFFSRNQTMIVTEVTGLGSQKYDLITVAFQRIKNGSWRKAGLWRPALWKTGYNIHDNKNENVDTEISENKNRHDDESVNTNTNEDKIGSNEGRETCLVCNEPTTILPSLMKTYTICNNPKCSWYKN